MKTNKSFAKRMKVTRTGKILTRKPGQNHFNAKASRNKQLQAKKSRDFRHITTKKELGSLLPLP